MFNEARKENRIITNLEANLRKVVGASTVLAMILLVIFHEPARTAYGPVSMGILLGAILFRTGMQGL